MTKKSKDKKPKKKTKAEIEADERQAEKEAGLLRQEEEAQAAARKKKEFKAARLLMEQRTEWRNEEVVRLNNNHHEMAELLAKKNIEIQNARASIENNQEWRHHLNCNDYKWQGMRCERGLNEFLTATSSERRSIEESFQLSDVMFKQAEEIEAEASFNDQAQKLCNFVPMLRHRAIQIIDEVTLKILQTCEGKEGASRLHSVQGQSNQVHMYMCINRGQNKELEDIRFRDSTTFRVPESMSHDDFAIRFCIFASGADRIASKGATGDFMSVGNTYRLDVFALPRQHTGPEGRFSTCICNLEPLMLPQNEAISILLPKPGNFIFTAETSLATYDEAGEDWIIEEKVMAEVGGSDRTSLTMSIMKQGTFAFVQKRGLNFGYKNWLLCPRPENASPFAASVSLQSPKVVFSLETPLHNIEIEVQETLCRLVSPDLPELKHCTDNWLSPKPMLQQLQLRGVNLLPSSSDCEMVTERQPKVTTVEQRAYKDCSWMVSSNMICCRASPLNISESGKENMACLEIIENPALSGRHTGPNDWMTALVEVDSTSQSATGVSPKVEELGPAVTDVKCGMIYDLEGYLHASGTDGAYVQRTTSQIHIMQCVQPLIAADAHEGLMKSNSILSNTVFELLRLTRPLSLQTIGSQSSFAEEKGGETDKQ
jgi:hypothetical protein